MSGPPPDPAANPTPAAGPAFGADSTSPAASPAPFPPPPPQVSQYDPLGASPAPVRRPATAILAVVALGLVAGLELLQLGISVYAMFFRPAALLWHLLPAVIMNGLLTLALLVVILLVARGLDGGRIIAVALAGAVCWKNVSGLTFTGLSLVRVGLPSVWGPYVSLLLMLLSVIVAATVILVLATGSASEWFHRRRRRP